MKPQAARFLALAAVLAFTVQGMFAQQPAAAGDHELIVQLLARVVELEAEVKALRGSPGLAGTGSAGTGPAPAVAQTAVTSPPPAGMGSMPGMPDTGNALPGVQIRGFSDVNFGDSTQKGSHSAFSTGQFNLFMTSRLNDKFSLLSELVFEYDQTNTLSTDLERLLFQWNASDYFSLSAGRYHTAIGYYNTAYHHATWLQTTAMRPFLFSFEDAGGILPIHNVGVSATGAIPSGPAGLHWIAEIGNGRTSHNVNPDETGPVQQAVDENSRKSFNVAVYARPVGIPGLQTGFSMYLDRLYPVNGNDGGNGNGAAMTVGESIWDGYVTWHPTGFELTAEGLVMRHNVAVTGRTYNIPGFYLLASRQFGKYRPYFSWDYVNVPRFEPVWGGVGRRGGPATGLRYDFSDYAAFKLEYYRLVQRSQPDVNGVRSQLTFTF